MNTSVVINASNRLQNEVLLRISVCLKRTTSVQRLHIFMPPSIFFAFPPYGMCVESRHKIFELKCKYCCCSTTTVGQYYINQMNANTTAINTRPASKSSKAHIGQPLKYKRQHVHAPHLLFYCSSSFSQRSSPGCHEHYTEPIFTRVLTVTATCDISEPTLRPRRAVEMPVCVDGVQHEVLTDR